MRRLALLSLGLWVAALSGCATMSPQQLQASRGTGTRRTIPGPMADVAEAVNEMFTKASYSVWREGDTIYATHSAGLSVATFMTPGESDQSTETEMIFSASLLGADFLRKTEADSLKGISDQVELKQLRRKAQAPPEAAAKGKRRGAADAEDAGQDKEPWWKK